MDVWSEYFYATKPDYKLSVTPDMSREKVVVLKIFKIIVPYRKESGRKRERWYLKLKGETGVVSIGKGGWKAIFPLDAGLILWAYLFVTRCRCAPTFEH